MSACCRGWGLHWSRQGRDSQHPGQGAQDIRHLHGDGLRTDQDSKWDQNQVWQGEPGPDTALDSPAGPCPHSSMVWRFRLYPKGKIENIIARMLYATLKWLNSCLLYYSSQFLYWILQDMGLHIQDNTQKDQFFCGVMEMRRQRHSLFGIMLDILECFLMQVCGLDGGGREDLL